jgi:hypothetical protein
VRFGRTVLAGLFVGLTGCGYVGPVLPPSPDIPDRIADLAAIETGGQLKVTFSVPPRTTDSVVIRRYETIDLAIGPAETPFDFEKWSAIAQHFDVVPPPPPDVDAPRAEPVSKTVPVDEFIGKHVAIAVRTSTKKEDHFSQWSNRAVMDIVKPLAPPAAKVEATRNGYLLTWPDEGAGIQYVVLRRGPADKTAVEIGTSDTPLFLDGSSQWDTPYTYTVEAQTEKGLVRSESSRPLSVNHPDTFPPEVPASVTALAGPESIEVSWSRSPDADLKGYFVYRSTGGGEFTRQGDLVNLPNFSDRSVAHGNSYRYEISAVDQKGNESGKSQATAPIAF